jgi:hypothetical protein
MDYRHVILKAYYAVENQPLSLIGKVVIGDPLFY